MVTVEDGQKRSLGSGGSLGSTEAEVVAGTGEVAEVPEEVLEPEAGTLADSGELCRLVVGVPQGSEVFMLDGKLGEFVNYVGEFGEHNFETLFEEDEICIVGAVTAGSYADTESEMSIRYSFYILEN